jgi:hypothetical protein
VQQKVPLLETICLVMKVGLKSAHSAHILQGYAGVRKKDHQARSV